MDADASETRSYHPPKKARAPQRRGRRKSVMLFILKKILDLWPQPGDSGLLECPVCNGELAFAVMHNGDIQGCCRTPNCIAWAD
jgi:hypothetical protein